MYSTQYEKVIFSEMTYMLYSVVSMYVCMCVYVCVCVCVCERERERESTEYVHMV